MASEAGRYFKERIPEIVQAEGNSPSEHIIKVESSPFLRCLQTAANIATELSIDTVNVNYRVCEVLREGKFPEAQENGGIFETLELNKNRETVS